MISAKNRNSCDPLQNQVPVKNSSGKHRKKKKSSGILFFLVLSPKNKFLKNRNYQPSILVFLRNCYLLVSSFVGLEGVNNAFSYISLRYGACQCGSQSNAPNPSPKDKKLKNFTFGAPQVAFFPFFGSTYVENSFLSRFLFKIY